MAGIQVAEVGFVTEIITSAAGAGSVLVVSSNPETLDGLTQYFSQAGVPSRSRRTANPLAELPRTLCALVAFPDDFPQHEVSSYLSLVRTRRPDISIVIVTRDEPSYTQLKATNGRSLDAVVLARPAFGWVILDVIKAARASGVGSTPHGFSERGA